MIAKPDRKTIKDAGLNRREVMKGYRDSRRAEHTARRTEMANARMARHAAKGRPNRPRKIKNDARSMAATKLLGTNMP